VEVEVLEIGVGHRSLGLWFVQAESSYVLTVLASTWLAPFLWEGTSQVSISPQWMPGCCTWSSNLCRDSFWTWRLAEFDGQS